MMHLAPGLLLTVAIGSLACQQAGPPPIPPMPRHVPQRAGVLYEGDLWTKPADSQFGASTCRLRRFTGCEAFPRSWVGDVAIDGQRLVVLMQTERQATAGGFALVNSWDLLISDDLGQTVRRFPLEGLTLDGRHARLHLFRGRILLLASVGESPIDTARVFEIDPVQGLVTARGGTARLSSAYATALPDGTLTTVAFGRDRPPQVISLTRFDPATNSIQRDDLDCAVAGCDPYGFASFVSSDSDLFSILVTPAGPPPGPGSCLLSVRVSTKALVSECFPDLSAEHIRPVSSFGGPPYDFQFFQPEGDLEWSLVPVTRNWIPSGQRMVFASYGVHWVKDGFMLFTPTGSVTAGDTRLLRLLPDGKLQQTAVQHDGCLDLSSGRPDGKCARAVDYRALPGDQVLFVTTRDEFDEDTRSRQLFEVHRSAAPFVAFTP